MPGNIELVPNNVPAIHAKVLHMGLRKDGHDSPQKYHLRPENLKRSFVCIDVE